MTGGHESRTTHAYRRARYHPWQSPRRGRRFLASLIALVCDSHPDRGPEGPFITLVDGLWAYCPRGYADGAAHRWRPIEPTSVEMLRVRGTSVAHDLHAPAAGK